MKSRVSLVSAMITAGVLATPAAADPFFFNAGGADGRLGALSRGESPGKVETETADDFILTETTVISGATITGLINAPLANITNVEVELYNKFPLDSVNPPSGRVLSRVNSPADVEIDAATRDASDGTLSFFPTSLNASFFVSNTVVNGINPTPSRTGGEGPASGEEVQITITFTEPIILPAGQYFFRPEVVVTGGDFLYLSVAGTPAAPDLQAWIRNSSLAPDWVRARVLAVAMLVFQGAVAVGSATWGALAESIGLDGALLWAGVGIILTRALTVFLPLPAVSADLTPWNHWRVPVVASDYELEGPVTGRG